MKSRLKNEREVIEQAKENYYVPNNFLMHQESFSFINVFSTNYADAIHNIQEASYKTGNF